MAHLYVRDELFYVRFRYQGKAYKKALKTRDKADAQVLKLRYLCRFYPAARYSAGNAAMSRRFSLATPPGVFSLSERYFSSRASHS